MSWPRDYAVSSPLSRCGHAHQRKLDFGEYENNTAIREGESPPEEVLRCLIV